MSRYKDYFSFAYFTIKENLTIVKYCLETPKRKNTDSCYGMPALILLSSIVDTIGTFYRTGQYQTITIEEICNEDLTSVKNHFVKYHNRFLSEDCEQNDFVDLFYKCARCKATHNSVLGPQVILTKKVDKNKHVLSKDKAGKLTIHLFELYENVKQAFKTLQKESKQVYKPERPISSTGSTVQ